MIQISAMALKVNKICSEIIEKVNNSNLDFKMNQTPYSLHFSIRKKFSKTRAAEEQVTQHYGVNVCEDPSQNSLLRQELINMRSEYEKLFKFYELEMGLRINLEKELKVQNERSHELELELLRADEALGLKEHLEKESKKVKAESLDSKAKYENKCLEFKNLKVEIENIKKEKNSLSVALVGSRKENKDQNKSFEKEREKLVKKISELNVFKSLKLNEEKTEKMKKKKEMKKLKQLEKKENTKNVTDQNFNNTPENEGKKDEALEELESFEFNPAADSNETKPVDKLHENIDEVEEIEDSVEKLRRKETYSTEINEFDEGFVYDEEFIGPRLPRRMTEADIKEFYEKIMAELKFPAEERKVINE